MLSPARLSPAPAVPNWVHPQARRVAGEAAASVHGHPSRDLFVVAVTGTNGKTTTAHLAGQLLSLCGRSAAVLGTTGHVLAGGLQLHATHTTPDAPELQRLLARHRDLGGDAVALELSSHALEQERHAGLAVDVAIFTNLTRDHLDYHGDMDRYAAAKRRLFEGLTRDGTAVVRAGDPFGDTMAAAAAERGAHVLRFGTGSRVDLGASDVVVEPGGTHFSIHGMGISRTRVFLPLVGRFNVENALAALAAVLSSGVSPSNALDGLASVSPAPGRLEAVPTGERGFTVLVDYAHTPDALASVLGTLRDVRGEGRLVCLFGCGGDRDRGKRAPMGRVVGELADVAVVTSDNPRGEDPAAIVAEVCAGMEGTDAERIVEVDRKAAIERALALAQEGDLVLLAGKGHETIQVFADRSVPFDDRAVARAWLERPGPAR